MSTKVLKGIALGSGMLAACVALAAFVSLARITNRVEQSKTLQNLQAAYNSQVNAHARYTAFADRAQHEEYYEVASLFRAAAFAEHIHFERFAGLIRKMGAEPVSRIGTPAVKTTAENLQTVVDEREASEREALYPSFIREAEAEGNEEVVRAFQYVLTSEVQHLKLLKAALTNLEITGVESHPYYVCRACGFTLEHPAKPCPGCSDPHASYTEVF